ncbi:MAG: CGNR zinc finger domain-containing protein [Solirubrobacteraceae bacterium]
MRKLEPETTYLWGGSLCLDFTNTVDWSEQHEALTPETDVLRDPEDLTRWAKRLAIFADQPPLPDEDELLQTHALRLAVYRTFAAHTAGEDPPVVALRRIAADHAEAASAGRLSASSEAWRLDWPEDEPRRVRFSVAVDTLAILADPARLRRVRRCPGRGCGWLFLDVSGRRRWCSMTTCGSREKMRRLYEKQHSR